MSTQAHIFQSTQPLNLKSGATLASFELAYETYGTLNAAGTNAIWVCHALTGSAHVAAHQHTTEKGWWEAMVGPGLAIDTNTYFVVCSTLLGSCKGSTGPTHTNPETGTPYGLDFPVLTIEDCVHAQKQLCDQLHISRLAAVVGPSMGGMQALQWAISYPEMLQKCVVIASSACLSPQALAFGMVGRNAIVSDSRFNDGNYADDVPRTGLGIARMIGHITYLSQNSIQQKFGRKLQDKSTYGYEHSADFQVESYLNYQGDKFVDQFDANSYLYLSKMLSYFDLANEYGSLEAAFEQCKASFLFVSISSDWLYPTTQSKEMVRACMKRNKQVSFCEVQSDYGHDAFLIEPEPFAAVIAPFLRNVVS